MNKFLQERHNFEHKIKQANSRPFKKVYVLIIKLLKKFQ